MKKVFLPDSEATERFGEKFSRILKPGDIVKITGSLGAGKTTLVRGLVGGLGGDAAEVHSPTFSLVHEYESLVAPIIHCDFYRLSSNSGLEEFGGAEFFEEEKIYFIEWPDQIRLPNLPISRRSIDVHLETDATGRSITFSASLKIVD
ncbi:MAG: tRNA (adenosine(37)-N6)-threonylcarbamoyltransferase complex ATPase subunit type 1 TsaE [Bacteriovoracia bacterium]